MLFTLNKHYLIVVSFIMQLSYIEVGLILPDVQIKQMTVKRLKAKRYKRRKYYHWRPEVLLTKY